MGVSHLIDSARDADCPKVRRRNLVLCLRTVLHSFEICRDAVPQANPEPKGDQPEACVFEMANAWCLIQNGVTVTVLVDRCRWCRR